MHGLSHNRLATRAAVGGCAPASAAGALRREARHRCQRVVRRSRVQNGCSSGWTGQARREETDRGGLLSIAGRPCSACACPVAMVAVLARLSTSFTFEHSVQKKKKNPLVRHYASPSWPNDSAATSPSHWTVCGYCGCVASKPYVSCVGSLCAACEPRHLVFGLIR